MSTHRSDWKAMDALIAEAMARPNLSADDILRLTIARRLNVCSESSLARALGDASEPPLNFWGRR